MRQYDPIPLPEPRLERWVRWGVYVLLATLLIAIASVVVTEARGDDSGTNAPAPYQPSLNVAQLPPVPPPEATVKITASTQPTEDGKAPPPPDVSVKIPMQSILPFPMPQPNLDDKGWTPKNVWELFVSALVALFLCWIAAPVVRDIVRARLGRKPEPPPLPPTPPPGL